MLVRSHERRRDPDPDPDPKVTSDKEVGGVSPRELLGSRIRVLSSSLVESRVRLWPVGIW